MQTITILIKNGIASTAVRTQTPFSAMTSVATSALPPRSTVGADTLSVADLAPHRAATITGLAPAEGAQVPAGVLQRLAELGFMAGETVSVLQRGPGGREPIAVQVGDTVFALRRHEASCIQVRTSA
jgi:ferrous iron transport protein A